jgi:hypothetical protein
MVLQLEDCVDCLKVVYPHLDFFLFLNQVVTLASQCPCHYLQISSYRDIGIGHMQTYGSTRSFLYALR